MKRILASLAAALLTLGLLFGILGSTPARSQSAPAGFLLHFPVIEKNYPPSYAVASSANIYVYHLTPLDPNLPDEYYRPIHSFSTSPGYTYNLDWSRDGKKFVYAVDYKAPFTPVNPPPYYTIETMQAGGTEHKQIFAVNWPAGDPAWSPDGKQIAFTGDADENHQSELYLIQEDGTGLKNILTAAADQVFSSPSWSPDGTQIIFSSLVIGQGNRDLYRVQADGTGLTNLTGTPGVNEFDPAWAHSGSRIAYLRDSVLEIWDLESGERVQVFDSTPLGGWLNGQPAWSPDDSQLLFLMDIPTPSKFRSAILNTVNADGSHLRQLTVGGTSYSPVWIP